MEKYNLKDINYKNPPPPPPKITFTEALEKTDELIKKIEIKFDIDESENLCLYDWREKQVMKSAYLRGSLSYIIAKLIKGDSIEDIINEL